jgi:MFS family permease
MTSAGADLEGTFQRAWALLIKNFVIVVPGLVLGLAAGLLVAVVVLFGIVAALAGIAAGGNTFAVSSAVITAIVAFLVVLAMAIVQTAFITGMAGAAWATGTTTLSDGWNALRQRGVQIFYMMLLMFAIGCAALILAPVTLLLSLFAYVIFFIYVSSSVIIGGCDAREALADSCRLAARNFWPTTGLAALVVCVSLVGAVVGSEIGHVQPFLGSLTAIVVQQAVLAYATLAIVGEYLKLSAQRAAA